MMPIIIIVIEGIRLNITLGIIFCIRDPKRIIVATSPTICAIILEGKKYPTVRFLIRSMMDVNVSTNEKYCDKSGILRVGIGCPDKLFIIASFTCSITFMARLMDDMYNENTNSIQGDNMPSTKLSKIVLPIGYHQE